jgi:hypothetical protein
MKANIQVSLTPGDIKVLRISVDAYIKRLKYEITKSKTKPLPKTFQTRDTLGIKEYHLANLEILSFKFTNLVNKYKL